MDARRCAKTATNSPNRLSPIGVLVCACHSGIFTVQSDGALHFVQSVHTLHDAKARVRELGKLWPGEYVIENEENGGAGIR